MGNNVVLPYSWLQVCGRVHWSGAVEKQETETLLHSAIVLICSPQGASLPLQPRDMSQKWQKIGWDGKYQFSNAQTQSTTAADSFIYLLQNDNGWKNNQNLKKQRYSPTLLSYTI